MGLRIRILLLQLLLGSVLSFAGNDRQAWFDETPPLPSIPHGQGLAAPFAGVSDDALILAGGSWFEPGAVKRSYGDSIYVFRQTTDGRIWQPAGMLPAPVAYGVSVTIPEGVLCLGGEYDDEPTDKVFLMSMGVDGVVIEDGFPPLPAPATKLSAAAIGRNVYVVAGDRFWCLDLVKRLWQVLPKPPFESRLGAMMLSQSNGVNQLALIHI